MNFDSQEFFIGLLDFFSILLPGALLARRGRPLLWLACALIWLVFKAERNFAVDRAGKIKQQALGALQAKDAINTFQWSKVWLNAESPASLAVVQRFEANSKFFRCFTVVLLLVLIVWHWQNHWPLASISVVLALLLLACGAIGTTLQSHQPSLLVRHYVPGQRRARSPLTRPLLRNPRTLAGRGASSLECARHIDRRAFLSIGLG